MSEADYMDDCQHASRYDEDQAEPPTHEVVGPQNEKLFSGSRTACWAYRRKRGGYVRETQS